MNLRKQDWKRRNLLVCIVDGAKTSALSSTTKYGAWNSQRGHCAQLQSSSRAVGSGPAGPVLAGPVFFQDVGVA